MDSTPVEQMCAKSEGEFGPQNPFTLNRPYRLSSSQVRDFHLFTFIQSSVPRWRVVPLCHHTTWLLVARCFSWLTFTVYGWGSLSGNGPTWQKHGDLACLWGSVHLFHNGASPPWPSEMYSYLLFNANYCPEHYGICLLILLSLGKSMVCISSGTDV